jgi:hypothetical protein
VCLLFIQKKKAILSLVKTTPIGVNIETNECVVMRAHERFVTNKGSSCSRERIRILMNHLKPYVHIESQCVSQSWLHAMHCSANRNGNAGKNGTITRRTNMESTSQGSSAHELQQNQMIHLRELFERIINLILDIYIVLEKDDEEEQKEQSEQNTKANMQSRMHHLYSPSEPDGFNLSQNMYEENSMYNEKEPLLPRERTQEIRSHVKGLLLIPFYSTLIINSAEVTLNVMAALSLIMLVLATRIHKIFQYRVRPFVLYYSLLLDFFIKKQFSQLNQLSEWRRKILLQFLNFAALFRRNKPKQYYRLLSIYLKLVNFAMIPKRSIKNLFWFITALYFQTLLFSIYILKRLSPRLQMLLEKSWSELYALSDNIVKYAQKTPAYTELN